MLAVAASVMAQRPYKTVLLVGASGSGKSTIANLLYHGQTLHDGKRSYFNIVAGAAPGTVHVTKPPPVDKAAVRPRIIPLDTIGLFHYDDSDNDAEEKLVDVLIQASNGVDAIIFCQQGRMSSETHDAFKYVERLIDSDEVKRRLVLIYTHLPTESKLDKTKQEKWMREQCNADRSLKEMVDACDNRWILVDIPPIDTDAELERKFRLYRKDALDKIQSTLQKMAERDLSPFCPEIIYNNWLFKEAYLKACEAVMKETSDEDEKNMIRQLRKECKNQFKKAARLLTGAELSRIIMEDPEWLKPTKEKAKRMARDLNFNGPKVGAGIGAAVGAGGGAAVGAGVAAGVGAAAGGPAVWGALLLGGIGTVIGALIGEYRKKSAEDEAEREHFEQLKRRAEQLHERISFLTKGYLVHG